MQEVDINNLINENNELIENIPNNVIIVGKINELNICFIYNKLNLSKLECNIIKYVNQEGNSIKNHILPNSLKILTFTDSFITRNYDKCLYKMNKAVCMRENNLLLIDEPLN